jgi:hypothetical protein
LEMKVSTMAVRISRSRAPMFSDGTMGDALGSQIPCLLLKTLEVRAATPACPRINQ